MAEFSFLRNDLIELMRKVPKCTFTALMELNGTIFAGYFGRRNDSEALMEEIIQKALTKGVEMHIAGEFDLASQLYESVIKLQPEHADANHNMGLLKLDLGLDLEALPFLAVALQADTSIAQFWLSYIKTLIKLERYEHATRILDLAEEAGFGEVEFLELRKQVQLVETSQRLEKGIEAHKLGQIQDAADIYGDILKDIPDHSDANHNMGVLLSGQGNLEEAIIFFDKALKANASIEQYWVSYLETLVHLGQIEKAQKLAVEESPEGLSEVLVNRIHCLLSVQESDPTQPPPQEIVDYLLNLYNQGQLMLAAEQAKVHLKQYSKSFVLWNVLGAAERGLGNNEKASKAFKKVTQLNPNFAGGFNNLGATLQDQGKLDDAILAFEKAISLTPDYAEAYNNMGNALQKQGNLEEAIATYNKAIVVNPNYADAYNNKGNVLRDQGNLEEAIATYNKAIVVNPDHADAYSNKGNALRGQGNLEEAIVAFTKALSIQPDYAEVLANLGNAIQEQGKLEEAIGLFEKAITIKPNYPEVLINKGNALKAQGKLEKAIEAYNKALTIKPDDATAYNNIGATLKEQGKLEEAIDAYNKALALKPDYAEAFNNKGNALKGQGKFYEAIGAYHKALTFKPDYAEASHMLASLSSKTTKSAPREYVENLFDGYAAKFEDSLLVGLEYQIPKVLTKLALQKHGSQSLGSILELGCGTGLTGVEIREFCSNLVGVDLSSKMLEVAKTKNVYDQLSHADILEYLSNAELDFDYFISTDVFIYIGDLSEVFRLIKDKNKKPGKFIFSTEHTEKEGFNLETSGRYTHSYRYIEGLCKKFKFSISHFSRTDLRKEKGLFLTGGLYLLDF